MTAAEDKAKADDKTKAEVTSEAGNVPASKEEKPPRAQGERAKRYDQKKSTRDLHPDVVPGMYKTR